MALEQMFGPGGPPPPAGPDPDMDQAQDLSASLGRASGMSMPQPMQAAPPTSVMDTGALVPDLIALLMQLAPQMAQVYGDQTMQTQGTGQTPPAPMPPQTTGAPPPDPRQQMNQLVQQGMQGAYSAV